MQQRLFSYHIFRGWYRKAFSIWLIWYFETAAGVSWNESELENDDLKNYKAKAEYYIREHQDNEAIKKLKSNIPLSHDDIEALEKVLWSELGTKKNMSRSTVLSRWGSSCVSSSALI